MTATGVYGGNSPSGVTAFESWLGKPVDHVLAYFNHSSWTEFDSSAKWVSGLWGATGHSMVWSVPLIATGSTLKAAGTGAYNDHYLKAARELLAAQPGSGDIVVRTGWEFNGSWFPWAAKGREQDFIAAWHQFVDTFRSISPRFKFEWNVNHGDVGMNPETAYPGDAYVDIVGMDFYYNTGWDPADPEAAWKAMVTRSYGLQWHQDFAVSHSKPTAYSEWGIMSNNMGPYIQHAADWFAQHQVAYHNYWDSNSDYAGKLSNGTYPGSGAEFRDEFGSVARNILIGTSGVDTLTGTDRSELIDGGPGNDRMAGGLGDDTYIVQSSGDLVVEQANGGTDTVRSHLAKYTLPRNVENLDLMTAAGQTGIGNALANRIIGGAGDDIIEGGAGKDLLMGGEGKDTFIIRPGTERDTIADFAAGAGAGDVVQLDSFAMTSFAQVKAAMEVFGKDTILTLPDGSALVFTGRMPDQFASDDFMFTGTPPAARPAWNPAEPPVAPSGLQTWTTGTAANDVLTGGATNDFLNGNGGTDTLIGGKGHDVYVVDLPADIIVEKAGEGIDAIQSWSRSYIMPDNVEHLSLSASYSQTAVGNALANRITGGSGSDTIDGGAGDDWLTGKGGNDTFIISANSGHDVILDFAAGAGAGDVVKLNGIGLSTFQQVKAGMKAQGADTVLNLPGGATVLVKGVGVAQFAADDFTFAGPAAAPPAPQNTIVVRASGDAWNGNAMFRLMVDGKQVGSDKVVTAVHGTSWQEFVFRFDKPAAPDVVGVKFFNDAYGKSSLEDRNLYVDHIRVNGTVMEAEDAVYDRVSGVDLTHLEKMSWAGTMVFDI